MEINSQNIARTPESTERPRERIVIPQVLGIGRTNIISFSGGKDSTALILWAKETLETFETIFMDTGWEHEITYKYVDYINEKLLAGKLVRLKSKKYDGFEDLMIKKGRVASAKARYCTEQLKIIPAQEYLLEKYDNKIELFLGERAEESRRRAKKPMREFDTDIYGAYVNRPLLHWTAEQVFEIHKKYGIEPNPLYKLGFSRVGCLPCIMSRHSELKLIARHFPERIERVRELEKQVGRTFCSPNVIPDYAKKARDPKSGVKIAWIDDVMDYVGDDPNQGELFEFGSCMSKYNICE